MYKLPGGTPSGVESVPRPSSSSGASTSTADRTSSLHLTSYFQSYCVTTVSGKPGNAAGITVYPEMYVTFSS